MSRTAARRGHGGRKKIQSFDFAEEEHPFVHDEIMGGVKAQRVRDLIDRGVLNAKQVFRVIPERTFNRRLANREPLKPGEADAIGRLLRVTEMATKTFGDALFARRFLDLPNPALNDRIPYELAETDAGAREVEVVLTRIAHGVYS
jgi:putative toxin-antitoxin system antitoxin component (TIGR02293 family)